jgi:hypothetical protein
MSCLNSGKGITALSSSLISRRHVSEGGDLNRKLSLIRIADSTFKSNRFVNGTALIGNVRAISHPDGQSKQSADYQRFIMLT